MGHKKKVGITKTAPNEITVVLPSPKPEVKAENSSENPAIEKQECPSEACQELQDIWASGKGCYNSSSKYCISCGKDFPAAKEICEKRTLEAAAVIKEKKTASKSTVVRIGFGHKQGTQAAGIDCFLQEGHTKTEFLELMNSHGYNKNKITDYDMWMRIQTHFRDLKVNHGIVITKVDGIYKGVVGQPVVE